MSFLWHFDSRFTGIPTTCCACMCLHVCFIMVGAVVCFILLDTRGTALAGVSVECRVTRVIAVGRGHRAGRCIVSRRVTGSSDLWTNASAASVSVYSMYTLLIHVVHAFICVISCAASRQVEWRVNNQSDFWGLSLPKFKHYHPGLYLVSSSMLHHILIFPWGATCPYTKLVVVVVVIVIVVVPLVDVFIKLNYLVTGFRVIILTWVPIHTSITGILSLCLTFHIRIYISMCIHKVSYYAWKDIFCEKWKRNTSGLNFTFI